MPKVRTGVTFIGRVFHSIMTPLRTEAWLLLQATNENAAAPHAAALRGSSYLPLLSHVALSLPCLLFGLISTSNRCVRLGYICKDPQKEDEDLNGTIHAAVYEGHPIDLTRMEEKLVTESRKRGHTQHLIPNKFERFL